MGLKHAIGALSVLVLVSWMAPTESFAQPSSWTGQKRKGRKYRVRIDSAPQQAAVYLEDESHGIVGYTPWSGRLAKGNWKIILKKDGYRTEIRPLTVKRTRRRQETFIPMVRQERPGKVEVRADSDPNAAGARVWICLLYTSPSPRD